MGKPQEISDVDRTLPVLQALLEGTPLEDYTAMESYGAYHALLEQLNLVCLTADPRQESQKVREAWALIKHEYPTLREALEGPLHRLEPYTLRDIQYQRFAPRRWVCPPFFCEGLAILAGPPAIGKSYFALNLGLAVSQGQPAFGTLPTTKGDVLYLSFEDDQQGMQERVDTILEGDGSEWPDTFHVQHEDVPLLGNGLTASLEDWMDRVPDTRLIVIDVLGDVKPPRKQNSDWYLDDKALLKPLLRLAHRRHVCILLLHHTNRRINPDNPFESIHGGAGIEGTPDTKAVLCRGVSQADAQLAIRGRAVAEQRAAFTYAAGIWTYTGEVIDVQRSEERKAILDVIRNTPEGVSPTHVATMLNRNPVTTRVLMRRMLRDGEIAQVGYGQYQITPSGTVNSVNSLNSIDGVNSVNSSEDSNTYDQTTTPSSLPSQPQEFTGDRDRKLFVNSLSAEKQRDYGQELQEFTEFTQVYREKSSPEKPVSPLPLPVDRFIPTRVCSCGSIEFWPNAAGKMICAKCHVKPT